MHILRQASARSLKSIALDSLKQRPCAYRGRRTYSARPEDAIKNLQAAFQTPGSPFYLAPGERGPSEPDNWPEHDPQSTYQEDGKQTTSVGTKASPDTKYSTEISPQPGWPHNVPSYPESRNLAATFAREKGYDTESMVEWPVAWGDQDQFRHVNNVSFARYFETARVRVMQAFEPYMTTETFKRFMDGTGMGLVVKSVSIEYKRPVTFPDSLIIMSKPIDIDERKASFGLRQEAWSLKQKTVVARCTSVQVMYDFEKLKKGVMTGEVRRALDCISERSGTA